MSADSEIEKWLLQVIPASPFAAKAYVVGGYVRDQLLGLESQDLDVVVEQPGGAEALARWLHERHPGVISNPHALGAGYPIWQVAFKGDLEFPSDHGGLYRTAGATIEIADTQSEAFPDPATRQRVTVYGDLEQDCRRRDFTVNMLYRDLTTGEIRDPSGAGVADIRAGVLRGHPQADLDKIFSDDPLRMIRLVRFHCRFGWRIPPEVLDTVRRNAARARILSMERVRDEFLKIMERGQLAPAIELTRATGLLPELFAELLPMIGCGQDSIYHAEGDVWVHTLRVIAGTAHAPPASRVALQLAALLHDTGKPATRSEHGERVKFIHHETVSAGIAEKFLARLKFDAATARKVCRLVALHLRGGDASMWSSLKPARKLIRDAGDNLEDLLRLIEADSGASLGADLKPRLEHIPVLRAKLAKANEIPVRKRPVLTGRDVMEALGLPAGPQVGAALNYVSQLEDDYAERGIALDHAEALSRLRADFKPA